MFNNIIDGFIAFASFYNIFFTFLGVALGVLVGALPGVGSAMILAICTPLTFKMPSVGAIMFLLGIYVGGYYGGSISAVLINTPGTASACATVFDGYPMALQGKAGKALDMSLYGSMIGHAFGVVVLCFFTPLITKFAMKFTPYEYFAVILFSLTIIASVSGKSFVKGLISTSLGLLFASIGLDPILGSRRLTIGILELDSGIQLLPMLIGLFAVAEVLRQAERSIIEGKIQTSLPQSNDPSDRKLSLREFLSCKQTLLRSSVIGSFIGILPGIGGSTAAFMSYGRAKLASEHPENYGKGELDGVCAAETANNAVVGSSLVPLLTLGIPGSVSAAILVNALLIHDLVPGPFLLKEHSVEVYAIFMGLFFSTIALYFLGRVAIGLGMTLTKLPVPRLFPSVLMLCVVGAYGINNSIFDLKIMVFFGIMAYLLQKLEFPLAPFVIAFILTPMLELSIRQSMLISYGKIMIIFTRPIVILFFALTIIFIFSFIRQQSKKKD